MARLGKWFGRKPDQPEAKGLPAEKAAVTGSTDMNAEPVYGIKFVLDSGETRLFTQLPVTLGRAEDNSLVLQDDSVSAYHATVLFDERLQEICIQDLDSLNGVFISGQPTLKNVLADGMRISLGSFQLIFHDTGYIHPG